MQKNWSADAGLSCVETSRLTRRPHAKLEKMKKNVGAGSSLVRHVLVLVWLAR